VPYRVTVGKRKFAQGLAEIFERSTKRSHDVTLTEVVQRLKADHLH
jgi:Anticodon binding domain